MGKVIIIHNQKGGVGKTSMTYGLALELASRNYKILAIDCDGQANLTSDLLTAEQHKLIKRTLADALMARSRGDNVEMPINNVRENLDLVPSSGSAAGIDITLSRSKQPKAIFKSLLNSVRSRYDFILVDLAPAAGLLAMNILSSADFILIPALLDDNSYRGVISLFKFIERYVPESGTSTEHIGVVLNQYSLLSRLTRSVDVNFTKTLSSWILSAKIRRNVAVGVAMRQHVSFAEADPRCNAARDISSLADEILAKLRMPTTDDGAINLQPGDRLVINKNGIKIKRSNE